MPKQDYFDKGQLTDLSYLILLVLIKPRHGYIIMNEIINLTEDKVKIGPASLYTTLRKLTEAGYIHLKENQENRKTYQITEHGMDILQIEIDKRQKLADYGKKALEEASYEEKK